jgi:hypothetical protein
MIILLVRFCAYFYLNFIKVRLLKWEIREEISSLDFNGWDKVCIFAVYSKKIDLSLLEQVRALHSCGYFIVLVNNQKFENSYELDLLKNLCGFICYRDNVGRDFGSYSAGYFYAKEKGLLDETKSLIFCNNTYFVDQNFYKVINSLDESETDVTGLFESIYPEYHIQSFLIHIKNRSDCFRVVDEFWERYPRVDFRRSVIKFGEIGFTKWVMERELTVSSLFSVEDLLSVTDDLTDSVIELICDQRRGLLKYIESVSTKNPSHFLIHFFIKRYFIIKKDIVQKGTLTPFKLAVLLADISLPVELEELIFNHFKTKKIYFTSRLSRLLENAGVL